MALTDKTSSKTGILLIFVLIVIIIIVAFFFGGVGGIFSILKYILVLGLFVGFISFVVFVFYYLFLKKHRIDIPHENWKSYLRSALDNGADMMNDLVITGDKHHSSKRFFTIKGYLRIKGFDGKEYDLFVGKRNSVNLIEEYKIVILQPDQHTDLVGDVYVYGISFIMKYGYYFLNTMILDFDAIDKTVVSDTFRTLMYYTLGDMKGLIDRATGLDPDFTKQRQQEKLLKIPVLSGQQQQQQPPQ